MIGQVVGNFRILEKLGEGGMGEVFRALDLILEREVALKALRLELASQHDIAERFRTEAVVLARLNHPNIATLYSVFPHAERLFMVLEFVRGEALDAQIVRRRAIPWREAIGLIQQALDGLEHAHRMGVVHRDIKPANVMISDGGALKLMDFGIARILDRSRVTKTGHAVGTLHYMSPEQLQGRKVDLRSDLYSIGVVLYETVTGSVPFDKPSEYDVIKAQVEAPPPPPRTLMPGLPERLEQIILRALAKDPGERFQHAADFRIALEPLAERTPSSPLPLPAASDRLRETRWSGAALDAINSVQRGGGLSGKASNRLRRVANTAIDSLRGVKWRGALVLSTLLAISVALLIVVTRQNVPPAPGDSGLARAPGAGASQTSTLPGQGPPPGMPTGDVVSPGVAASEQRAPAPAPQAASIARGPEQALSPTHDATPPPVAGEEQRRAQRKAEPDAVSAKQKRRQEAARIGPNGQERVPAEEEARQRTQDERRTRPREDARVKTNEDSQIKPDQEPAISGESTRTPAAASRSYAAPANRVWTVSESVLRILGWDIDKRDHGQGYILTESRSLDKDNFGVFEKSLRQRLRVHITATSSGHTVVTVERMVFKRQRVMWVTTDEPVEADPSAGHKVEEAVLAAIARSL